MTLEINAVFLGTGIYVLANYLIEWVWVFTGWVPRLGCPHCWIFHLSWVSLLLLIRFPELSSVGWFLGTWALIVFFMETVKKEVDNE